MGKPCGWRALEKLPVKWFCINSSGCRKFYCNVICPIINIMLNRIYNTFYQPCTKPSCLILTLLIV